MIVEYYSTASPRLILKAKKIGEKFGVSLDDAWCDHAAQTTTLRSDFPELNAKYATEVGNGVFHLDLAQMWFSLMAEACFVAAVSQANPGNAPSALVLAASSICGKTGSDLLAIRMLVSESLCEQAKQITRSMSEGIDVLSRVTVDKAFCTAYLDCHDSDQQNRFWHKYVARGKTRDFVYSLVRSALGRELVNLEYRSAEEKILSAASHPSYYSGFSSLFPHHNPIEEGELIGRVRAQSKRTLAYVNYRCAEYAIFDGHISRATENMCNASPQIVESYDTTALKNECRCLREIVDTVGRQLFLEDTVYEPQGGKQKA